MNIRKIYIIMVLMLLLIIIYFITINFLKNQDFTGSWYVFKKRHYKNGFNKVIVKYEMVNIFIINKDGKYILGDKYRSEKQWRGEYYLANNGISFIKECYNEIKNDTIIFNMGCPDSKYSKVGKFGLLNNLIYFENGYYALNNSLLAKIVRGLIYMYNESQSKLSKSEKIIQDGFLKEARIKNKIDLGVIRD